MKRLLAIAILLTAGCRAGDATVSRTGLRESTEPGSANPIGLTESGSAPRAVVSHDDPKTAPSRGRTQMWTENCIRCHNARSPGYYSDREWQVAMHHMRVRCSITPKEYEAILGFLQSAN
jgi:hypothetical protein